MITKLVLLSGLAATWYMTGLIIFVHMVHYPLFAKVDPEAFPDYHAQHVRRTTPTVFLPMLVELVTAMSLVYRRPEGTSLLLAWAGLIAAAVCWITTAGISVPLHERLGRGFESEVHQALVRTNTIRLAAWVAHAVIMLGMAAQAME